MYHFVMHYGSKARENFCKSFFKFPYLPNNYYVLIELFLVLLSLWVYWVLCLVLLWNIFCIEILLSFSYRPQKFPSYPDCEQGSKVPAWANFDFFSWPRTLICFTTWPNLYSTTSFVFYRLVFYRMSHFPLVTKSQILRN